MAPKPPVEKLPLAARKSSSSPCSPALPLLSVPFCIPSRTGLTLLLVRDDWEIVKSNLATKIQELLGEPYSLEVDMLALYPYASDWAKTSPGAVVHNYFEGFVYQLERYLTNYGADGKSTFNAVVSEKKITLEIDDVTPKRFSYCGCDVKEGRFRILAGEDYLGTNINDACYEMVKAIEKAEEAAGGTGLSVGAKANVKETVDKEFPELEKTFSEILGYAVKLDANLEENYKTLKAKNNDFNDSYFGTVTLDYFKGFASNLDYLKFKGDDMMQEGFQEACEKGVIKVEVVDKLAHGSYNDIIFEDGICKLQVRSKKGRLADRR